MARPTEEQRRFATLFVSGPAYTRGKWDVCSVGAGMVEVPPLDTKVIRTLIEKLGGTPPPIPDELDPRMQAAEALANELAEAEVAAAGPLVTPTAEALAAVESEELDPVAALAAAAELGLPWAQMRDNLQTVMQSIASGTVRATAAQVAMLKYIVEQAKEDAAGAEASLGVVLLPVQGAGATMQLDPVQRKRATERLRADT